MSIYSPNQEIKPKTGEIYLINPTVKEFKMSYLDDRNKPVDIMFQPMESKSFPYATGNMILNHLIDFILNQGGFSYKTSINEEKDKIRAKCVLYE